MHRLFICLANSKKYGGRCLAGIEACRDENGALQLLRDEAARPRWLRPVSRTEHGQLPDPLTRHLHLLDLVAFEAGAACPEGFQRENCFYQLRQGAVFEKTGFLRPKTSNLEQLTDRRDGLLGNLQKSVSATEAAALDHSIVLIRAEPEQPIRVYEQGPTHLRMAFGYQNARFDLPVTDVAFHLNWIDRPELLADAPSVFLCVSLSRDWDGSFYKLVAGVMPATA